MRVREQRPRAHRWLAIAHLASCARRVSVPRARCALLLCCALLLYLVYPEWAGLLTPPKMSLKRANHGERPLGFGRGLTRTGCWPKAPSCGRGNGGASDVRCGPATSLQLHLNHGRHSLLSSICVHVAGTARSSSAPSPPGHDCRSLNTNIEHKCTPCPRLGPE